MPIKGFVLQSIPPQAEKKKNTLFFLEPFFLIFLHVKRKKFVFFRIEMFLHETKEEGIFKQGQRRITAPFSTHTRHTHTQRKTKETQSPILIQNKKKKNNTHTKKENEKRKKPV